MDRNQHGRNLPGGNGPSPAQPPMVELPLPSGVIVRLPAHTAEVFKVLIALGLETTRRLDALEQRLRAMERPIAQ